jgi:hypothetical protein
VREKELNGEKLSMKSRESHMTVSLASPHEIIGVTLLQQCTYCKSNSLSLPLLVGALTESRSFMLPALSECIAISSLTANPYPVMPINIQNALIPSFNKGGLEGMFV